MCEEWVGARAMYVEVISTHIFKVLKFNTIPKMYIVEELFCFPQLIFDYQRQNTGLDVR